MGRYIRLTQVTPINGEDRDPSFGVLFFPDDQAQQLIEEYGAEDVTAQQLEGFEDT